MSFDTLAGVYVYCMDYHTGQYSRLYRLLSRINARLSDSAIKAIQGNRHNKRETSESAWNEWEQSRRVYRQLKRRGAK